MPAIAAYAVILGETLGGLALIFGVLSRWAAGLSLPILLGATYMHWGNGWLFSNANGGWEFPVILVVMAAGVVLGGAGSFALENHTGVQKRIPGSRSLPNGKTAGCRRNPVNSAPLNGNCRHLMS